MLTVNYTRDGLPIGDRDAENYARRLISRDVAVNVSTANVIQALRCFIAEGDLDCENVRFLFDGQPVMVNRFGACTDWPNGWCDLGVRMAERTMMAAMSKKRAERGNAV
jgi:hypothetical protein